MKKNRKKNNKNYKLYAIIAVLVFFGAGYWVFQNKMRGAEASVASWDTASAGVSWTVPTGVTEVMVKVWGAGGGSGAGGDKGAAGGNGGGGGYAEAVITVTPDSTLTVMTGGAGGAGAYTGGGTKRSSGGGGGGFSAVKSGTTVLIQAGGGGGGGAGSTLAAYTGGAGGAGGGIGGTAGTQGADTCDASATSGGEGGSGGTQSAGGTAGTSCNSRTGDGQAGSVDQGGYGGVTGGGGVGGTNGGGAGGNFGDTAGDSGAGGGGGGYYGGGGGEVGAAMGGGGGGGGSATSTGSSIVLTAGNGRNPGNNSDYYYTTYCASNAGVGAAGGAATTNGSAGNVGCVVIIYNANAPVFSGDPVASPSIGGGGDIITFSATSTDADSDNWYLAVCKTNSITPSSPPTCASGETVCVSSSAVSSASGNTCEWTVDGSPGTMDWYAFACDDVLDMEKCSSANTANSPFTVTPGSTQVTLEDIYCAATGCTPATYNLDSPATATSTMYDLQEIYDAVSDVYYYSNQKNLIWDDAKGDASSTENSLAYAYANAVDQNKEESEWTAYTDTSLGTQTIASGAVYKDERTGLYWSHCYSAAQDGTCDTITNEFTLDGVVDPATGLDAEGGLAIDFCKNLSLDPNGNGDKTDWYLPSQKELMQAYVNGAGNNIPSPALKFWSSTEYYNTTSYAWYVYLSYGGTNYFLKTSNNYARCVRRTDWCGNNQVQDADDNLYNTVLIGEQCWMAENLNVGVYVTSIETASGHSDVSNNGIIEKYCYDNNESNCDTYGGLYDWNEMMGYVGTAGTQGICPTGWHIPTDEEWFVLENTLKDAGQTCDPLRTNYDCNPAGTKLKSDGTSGFGGLLAGTRYTAGSFHDLSSYTYFWTSNMHPAGSLSWLRALATADSRVERNAYYRTGGMSVRCLKD